jgi:hypothetical protein
MKADSTYDKNLLCFKIETSILYRYSFVILLAYISITCQAQLSFTNNGQQINNFDGRGVALGDFNNDGTLDAFVANQDVANNLKVYFNDGQGQFTDGGQQLSTPSTWWDTPAVGDINGDGRLEVITGNIVWLNDGQGFFTADTNLIDHSESGELGVEKLIDLNRDSHLDLFAIRNYAAMRMYLNDGSGHFTNSGQHLGDGTIGTGQVAHIATGDINRDGFVDAVTAGWRSDVSDPCPNHVWLNDSLGNFHDSGQLLDVTASHVHGLALGDLNDDGWLDLVMGIQDQTRAGRIYLNDGTGDFSSGTNFGTSAGEKVRLEDFDTDGDLDIFLARSYAPPSQVWLNNGSGSFQNSGVSLGTNATWDGTVGDLNADDKPDIFTVGLIWGGSNTAAPAKIWLNTTLTNLPENELKEVEIFPNPTSGILTISFGENQSHKSIVEIFGIDGKLMDSKIIGNKSSETIDLSANPNGIYLFKITDNNLVINRKVYLY